jgi:signal transduction histidine kinase
MVVEEEDADRHPAIVPVPATPGVHFPGFARLCGPAAPDPITVVPYHKISDPEKLGRLMDAVLMIEADIELPVLLGHLVEEARTLVGARYGALGVLNEARTGLEEFLTVGLTQSEEQAIGPRPTGRGVLGLLITDPAPLRLPELGTHELSYGFPPNHPPMKSFLGVPIRAKGEVFGNLYLTDKLEADDFTDEDEALAEALALAAGIAIDNTRLHDRVRTISVLNDRERIGRDLHDRVVQRLFAVGMALQGAARLPELDLVRERIDKVVDDLDATISEIRTTIFELGDSAIPGGLRQAVVGLADELAPTLGVRPELSFQGAIDNTIPQQTADHLLAVLREMLSNVGKHACATRVALTLIVADDITLEVVDNGIGIAPATNGHGLGLMNLRTRAEKLGGTFEIQTVESGGSKATWRVPT